MERGTAQRGINEGERLVIIAFQTEKMKAHHYYDFFFCTPNKDGTYSWRKAFYTNDLFSSLEDQAATLYNQITRKMDAVRLSPDIRSIVQAYLQWTGWGECEKNASFPSTQGKKHRKYRFSVLFHCKNAENGASQNAGQLLTHTMTHTRKCADRLKEYRRGGFARSPIFFILFLLRLLVPWSCPWSVRLRPASAERRGCRFAG